jgi:type I restriction-modification system DNA methylase subunit
VQRRDRSLPAADRRALGAHYTPPLLARQIVTRALEPHLLSSASVASLRICDPAMGDGVFLLEALRFLAPMLAEAAGITVMAAKQTIANDVLFGVDKDPGAVAAAIEALSAECEERVNPEHFVVGDALVGPSANDLPHGELFGHDWTIGGTVVPHDWGRWPTITCWIGNPPFLGGHKISGTLGVQYQEHLRSLHEIAYHGNADLCAHFLRRCAGLSGHGVTTMSFICTNTISQGDTRYTGLQYLCNFGWTIYDAITSMKWPGDAKVSVVVVQLVKGFHDFATSEVEVCT